MIHALAAYGIRPFRLTGEEATLRIPREPRRYPGYVLRQLTGVAFCRILRIISPDRATMVSERLTATGG